jgi:hypothetical protein
MWTPDGPKNIHGKPLTGKRTPPRFKVGDRVWILESVWEGSSSTEKGTLVYKQATPQKAGTVESAPKTSRGQYIVRFDGGYILNGRDCSQAMAEDCLAPMKENAEAASAGK